MQQPSPDRMPRRRRLAGLAKALLLACCFTLMGSRVILAQQVIAPPPPPPSAVAPVPAAASVPGATAVAGVPSVEEPPNNTPPLSIFFSPDDLQRISNAVSAYERSKREKQDSGESKANDFLNQLTEPAEKPKPQEPKQFIYPQFFLNSLVFHTPEDWVVLVNNVRYSSHISQLAEAELKIIGLDKDKVTLEWRPVKLDKVMESWERGPNPEINFDRVSGLVRFTLLPNQTFSSYAMRVAEGRLKPIVVNLRPEEPEPAPQPAKKEGDAKNVENMSTDDIKNDVGVKALDKTYKRIGLTGEE